MEQKRYHAISLAIFVVAITALLFRVLVYYVYNYVILPNENIEGAIIEVLLSLLFTLPVQVLGCLMLPFIILKLYQKKSTKQILTDSNFKKCPNSVMLLSIPLTIGQLMIATSISILWLTILINFGYNYSPSQTIFSPSFNIWYFLLAMFFTAVLPAICEEFAIRGTFLTTMQSHIKTEKNLLIIMALTFGLFHQNIVQLAYTSFFGALMAYIVIKTKSIYPAMLIHFLNNGLSVLLEYGNHYGFTGDFTFSYFIINFGFVGLMFTLVIGGGIVLLCLIAIKNIMIKKEKNEISVLPLEIFKPKLYDNAFIVGAIVVTALSTIFSLLFGF